MEMEGHHHHHHQQYNMATDLRQLVNEAARSSTHFPTAEQLFSGHRNLVTPPPPHPHQQQQHYEMMMLMTRGVVLDDFPTTATTTNDSVTVTVPPTQAASNIPEATGYVGGDASTGRWPRQETLSLLEIRSRLDPKFKEVNQKGPLWDEVSRMMYEEHGYQRSGKKCREKFENLYKYYKKTKEGKAGRHDGKHYRFFRQLEALYGENSNHSQVPSQTNNNNNKHCDSLSLTNSTDIDTSSSSEDNDSDVERRNKRKRRSCWKVKIKDFIDLQMKKLVEKQEEWLEKLVKTLEEKEKERVLREEEWREQEARRLEREHKFWAKERAWIEARDVALMEALQNITTTRGINIIKAEEAEADRDDDHHHDHYHEDGSEILGGGGGDSWQECEITRLQQLRSEILLETNSEEEVVTWERVANKMACFGYERSALMCKEKWESIISHYNIPRDDDSSKDIGNSNKKRIKENSSRSNTCFYFNNNNDHRSSSIYNNQGSTYCDLNNDQRLQTNNGCCSSPSNSNVGNVNAPGDTCFQFLMSDGGNLWENYGLKINKVNQNH